MTPVCPNPPDTTPDVLGLPRARAGAVTGAAFTGAILWCMLVASTALALAAALARISVIGMLVAASVIGGFATRIGLVILVRHQSSRLRNP